MDFSSQAQLPTITLHQPWASLMADKTKFVETRTWRPPPRHFNRLWFIHAAVRPVCPDEWTPEIADWWTRQDKPLPLGSVLCSALLVAVHSSYDPDLPIRVRNNSPFGDFSPGRWLWEFRHVYTFKFPRPARGKQGIWYW